MSIKRLAMVVEDDPGLRSIYRRVLTDIEFQVLEASDGTVAIELLKKYTPNIVFLDMLLPQLNGVAILEFINRVERLRQVQVIIVSSNKRYEQYSRSLPFAKFVLKPIRPGQIRELATATS